MNCLYCKQPCDKDAALQRCYKCNTTYLQDVNGVITTVCLYTILKDEMYYLKIAYNSGTARVYYVHSDTFLYPQSREEVVVWMDTIPEGVTPKNLNQKIKFLLTFS